jgi:AraC-like DNA-binding protein
MSRKRQRPIPVAGDGDVRTLSWDFPPAYRVPLHCHDWHQLIYATTGVMTTHTPEGTWVVPTHRAVWVPASVEHAIEMSGAVSMRTLYLSRRLPASFPDKCQVVTLSPFLSALVLHIVQLGGLHRKVASERRLLEVLLDQLQDVPADELHLPQPRDSRARRITDWLLEQPSDKRTLAELARAAAGSKRAIERTFKLDTGMTFGRWRQQLRLIHALRLLATGQPVTAVALDVGYESLSAFVHAFRKTFGITPGRYQHSSPY